MLRFLAGAALAALYSLRADPLTIPGAKRNGQVEKYAPGDRITGTVAAANTATGGRVLVHTAGDRQFGTAGATATRLGGVALWDAAAGEKIVSALEGIWMLRASGAIVAGDLVVTGAGGVVVAAGADPPVAQIVGKAIANIADGADGPVKLRGF